MASSIPLIRASAAIPCETWLTLNGLPAAELLVEAGLPASPASSPSRLVSLHALFQFLATMADIHGADFGARIATPEALMQLGVPGRALRRSRTVREALIRISSTFYQHASLVFMFANERSGGMEITETVSINGSAAMHHQAQQHVAAMICSIGYLANGRPLPANVRMSPHPRLGIDHLRPYLGDDIVSAEGRLLHMWIPDAVLDLALPWEPELPKPRELESQKSAARSSLTESAYVLIAGMVADGNPSIDRLALCSGRSRRTLQRMLKAEGTSFVKLLDAVRQNQVLGHLMQSHASVSSIGSGVGFRSSSSITRAVRRWTSTSPRQLRSGQRIA